MHGKDTDPSPRNEEVKSEKLSCTPRPEHSKAELPKFAACSRPSRSNFQSSQHVRADVEPCQLPLKCPPSSKQKRSENTAKSQNTRSRHPPGGAGLWNELYMMPPRKNKFLRTRMTDRCMKSRPVFIALSSDKFLSSPPCLNSAPSDLGRKTPEISELGVATRSMPIAWENKHPSNLEAPSASFSS